MHVERSEISLAFAETGGIDLTISVEVDRVIGVGGAVELALDRSIRAGHGDLIDDRIILQVVRADVSIAQVVRGHAIGIPGSADQINAQVRCC